MTNTPLTEQEIKDICLLDIDYDDRTDRIVEKVQSAKRKFKAMNCKKFWIEYDMQGIPQKVCVCINHKKGLNDPLDIFIPTKCPECEKIDACFQIDDGDKGEKE
jgi:hypothetical protein